MNGHAIITRARFVFATMAIMASCAAPAFGKDPKPVDRSKFSAADWEKEVEKAEKVGKKVEPTLIGGTVVNPADWPASPWVGNCSSTLLGPKVLITAAHCVGNGGTKTFAIGSTRYSAVCTHHPSYRSNSTADWALCLLPQPVLGVPLYESLPATAEEVACAVGKTFTLSGYGCQRWGGGIDGYFRVGAAKVVRCPSGTNYDIVTTGNVALCSGDSGGGGYTSTALDSRKNIMNNSRSNTTTTSYMPSYGTAAFRDWAKSWADGKGVKLCGLHADATTCRGVGGGTPPDPKPGCPAELAAAVTAQSGAGAALEALRACLAKK